MIDLNYYTFWLIVDIVWSIITIMITISSMTRFVFICKSLCLRYEEVYDDIKYMLKNKEKFSSDFVKTLNTIQRKHYAISDVLKHANSYWKIYLFIFYMISVPLEVFLLYKLFSTDTSW